MTKKEPQKILSEDMVHNEHISYRVAHYEYLIMSF